MFASPNRQSPLACRPAARRFRISSWSSTRCLEVVGLMVIVNLLRSWLQRRKQRRARPPASRWHQGALLSRRLGLQLLEDRNQPNDLLGAGGTDYLDPTAGSSS